MNSQELGIKLHSLYLAGQTRKVVLATTEQLNGFAARPSDCHRNADAWVELHPKHRVVRGFLVMSDRLFNKHSVVDTGAVLLDITPRPSNESRNTLDFIVFDGGSPEAFVAFQNQVICT
jgi:hypothetical protein